MFNTWIDLSAEDVVRYVVSQVLAGKGLRGSMSKSGVACVWRDILKDM